jgi:hypothetical protein
VKFFPKTLQAGLVFGKKASRCGFFGHGFEDGPIKNE